MIIKKSIELGGKTLTLETGRMAKQANGAVLVGYGETMVLVTAVADDEPMEDRGFFPLSVEYRHKTYSAGKFPGGFIKREARPSDKEILSARLVDRPIRPLFPDGFMNETQVIALILSMDKENDADVLAGIGASAALTISDIPFNGPVATVRVAKVDGELVVNPTFQQVEESEIEIILAGNADSIVMVEGEAKEVSEEEMLKAINFGHQFIKQLCALQVEIAKEVNPQKWEVVEKVYADGLEEKVTELGYQRMKEAVRIQDRYERRKVLKTIKKETIASLEEDYPEEKKAIGTILHDIEKKEVRAMIINENVRLDGRDSTEIRQITTEIGVLPRTHGSSLFTRGQTQSLGVCTLGSKSDEERIDALQGDIKKSYYMHYNFPPFCTGEVKMIRGVSRREVGHGNLAERALKPIIPDHEDFPYTIRLVSEIMESNGSSSMASVCSGSMALMDAGVPVKAPVAGIAMGLIKEDDKIAVLSDILGDEDHLGDMDFKVAGTDKGITAVQMDIKIDGISEEIMTKALQQAHEGRKHIMSKMAETITENNKELSRWAPSILNVKVPVDKIGAIIGPGGKTIRGIIESARAELDINIDDEGNVAISSVEGDVAEEARQIVLKMIEVPKVGKAYHGTVKRVKDFGCFVEFMPGKEGMVHISELELTRTNKVSDVVKEGDEIDICVKGVGNDGKISLSRKMFLLQQEKEKGEGSKE